MARAHRPARLARPARPASTPAHPDLLPGLGLIAGIAALAAGGIAAGLELERRWVSKRLRQLPVDDEPFFGMRSDGPIVSTPDGVTLHTETDELADGRTPEVTIVFVHGYALSLDCWHFQRKHFRARQAREGAERLGARLVFYDQRSHGRSARSDPSLCRVPQLADDLAQVLDEVVGADGDGGPVVLIGHSMGAMTIMHLASTRPTWFDTNPEDASPTGHQVIGVGLVATSSGGLREHSIIKGLPGRTFARITPPLLAGLNRIPELVERSRRAGTDLAWVITKQMGFGRPDVPASYVEFLSQMLGETPMTVVADFYPAFADLDETTALEVLNHLPTAVIGGVEDMITPVQHTERIIELVPNAESLILEQCGHMGIIEQHDKINPVLDDLVARALQHHG